MVPQIPINIYFLFNITEFKEKISFFSNNVSESRVIPNEYTSDFSILCYNLSCKSPF